ncbi:hypothetical protein KEM55_005672, partial [Ascosphaera atra]
AKHNNRSSCWVVIHGKVYDVTDFLPEHPGGAKIILKYAGKEATEAFDPVHPKGTLEENLPSEACLGQVDVSTVQPPPEEKKDAAAGPASVSSEAKAPVPTSLQHCLNMDDIELMGTSKLNSRAFSYYFSASDDLFTKKHNNTAYRQILLRPRVFKDVSAHRLDLSTSLLGHKVNTPIFISPTAMVRLAHPSGEAGIAEACKSIGAMQIISNNASLTPEEIVAEAGPDQVFGWQLYVQNDIKKSEAMLKRVNKLADAGKIKFLCLTLDAPVGGKRELDERSQFTEDDGEEEEEGNAGASKSDLQSGDGTKLKKSGGIGQQLFAGTASDLVWVKTLSWLNQQTALPIVLKGIQTHEDAYIASCLAEKFSIKAIILSNHGGRAADTAPPPVHTLLEIRKYCPEVFDKIELWVDGGIKRGTDVVKALCLGATAVGVGRNALYGLAAGGPKGVHRMLKILSDETATNMRLLGVNRISELGLQHVNARAVEQLIFNGPAGLSAMGDLLAVTEKAKL